MKHLRYPTCFGMSSEFQPNYLSAANRSLLLAGQCSIDIAHWIDAGGVWLLSLGEHPVPLRFRLN